MNRNSFWIAQRHGQDRQNIDVIRAVDLLKSVVSANEWSKRIDCVRQRFEAGKKAWASGHFAQLFDPTDAIAWYLFQASAYRSDFPDWYEPEAFRIMPVFQRIGQSTTQLESISGAMDRIQTLMTKGRSQPDDGIFELLVAAAYRRRGWSDVSFVPEQRGIAKTQDLLVADGRHRWAVECKRVNRSAYELQEQQQAQALANEVHELCRTMRRSMIFEVAFTTEISEVPPAYLAEKMDAFLQNASCNRWQDAQAIGRIREVSWPLIQAVMQHDDLFFGASRMVELLVGHYAADMDYSVTGDWTPAPGRPLFATAMSRACVVGWQSISDLAMTRKASHFRAIVGKAAKQLPRDCPGVVHVGYEARVGNSADALRHSLNAEQMIDFDPGESQLRWVYGNYVAPEHTNNPNESWALSETTAVYGIGERPGPEPLPSHLLFSNDSGTPGHHWGD